MNVSPCSGPTSAHSSPGDASPIPGRGPGGGLLLHLPQETEELVGVRDEPSHGAACLGQAVGNSALHPRGLMDDPQLQPGPLPPNSRLAAMPNQVPRTHRDREAIGEPGALFAVSDQLILVLHVSGAAPSAQLDLRTMPAPYRTSQTGARYPPARKRDLSPSTGPLPRALPPPFRPVTHPEPLPHSVKTVWLLL